MKSPVRRAKKAKPAATRKVTKAVAAPKTAVKKTAAPKAKASGGVAAIKLDSYSIADLKSLISLVETEIKGRQAGQIVELRARMAEMAKNAGIAMEDLVGGKTGKRKGPKAGMKVPAKYRDPKNPDNAWSGRGRQPRWLVAAIASGKKLADFAV